MMPGYKPRASAVISALFGVPVKAGTVQQCPLHEKPMHTLYVFVEDFRACCLWRDCLLHSRRGLSVADIVEMWLPLGVGGRRRSPTDRAREHLEDLSNDRLNDLWDDIWEDLKSELKDDSEDDDAEGEGAQE